MEPEVADRIELKFVDRTTERDNLFRLIRVKPSKAKVIALDSPVGMGKTKLLLEVCRELVRDAHRQKTEWRIVRLDFREGFPEQQSNKKDVLEEIARQICRDTIWASICDLVQKDDLEAQVLVRQAAYIPMKDESRKALLDMVKEISDEARNNINDTIAKAFKDADILEAREQGNLLSVSGLVGFILDKRDQSDHPPIPDHVLIVLDGVDAITEENLRSWVVNDLALGLGLQIGIQSTFRRFAVVVSGRFIEQDLDPSRKLEDFRDFVLQSFADRFDAVGDLFYQLHDPVFKAQANMVSRFARKLCQVCGGHPGVIEEIVITLYDRPGHFAALGLDPEGVDYWYDKTEFTDLLRKCRQGAISEILEGVGEQEQQVLKLLSAFRRFNQSTLEFLSRKIKEAQLHRYLDCFQGDIGELYDRLKETRLIGDDKASGPFHSDRYSLNLLSAQMRDEDPQVFRQLNEWAVELFKGWVKGKFSDKPGAPLVRYPYLQRTCVREWLYHKMHLVECCSNLGDAGPLGQAISDELTKILEDIVLFPDQSQAQQRQWIREHVEIDSQIDHLIWEMSKEDKARHDIIRGTILGAF
jgi:hypothetical protein